MIDDCGLSMQDRVNTPIGQACIQCFQVPSIYKNILALVNLTRTFNQPGLLFWSLDKLKEQ